MKQQDMTFHEPNRPKLTTEYILLLHDDLIEKFGGTKGVLNKGTIDYLIYLLDKKSDAVKKAALALELITAKHAFFDGNKRTGHLVADIILRAEGYHIHAEEEKILNALLKIASYECNVEEIERWLRRNIRPLHLG